MLHLIPRTTLRKSYKVIGSAAHISDRNMLLYSSEGIKRVQLDARSEEPDVIIPKVHNPHETRGRIMVPSSSGSVWSANGEW